MRTVCIALVFSLICFGQCKESDPLTQTQRAWVNEFVSLGITVNGSDPQLSDADLVPFDYLSDAKIVGLGEGSHGAHEFFQMKHRIFKYLVERYSFRAFAFEMDFAEAMIFDDYIQGKTGGRLKSFDGFENDFLDLETQEVLELFEWMRFYNVGKSESSKIHLFGVDCQFPTYNADFLVQRLSTVDPGFAFDAAQKLVNYKGLDPRGDSTNYASLLKSVTEIYNTIDASRSQYYSKGMSVTDYELTKQLARTIVQTLDEIYRIRIADYKFIYRDVYMAENAQWVSNFVGGNQKICLWGHDGHIKGDGNRDGNKMGYYLTLALKGQYKRVGTTFSNGSFNAVGIHSINSEPIESSTNFLLRQTRRKSFLVKISDITGSSPLNSYVSKYHGILATGATYNGVPADNYLDTQLRVAYDILVYFDTITPTQLFK